MSSRSLDLGLFLCMCAWLCPDSVTGKYCGILTLFCNRVYDRVVLFLNHPHHWGWKIPTRRQFQRLLRRQRRAASILCNLTRYSSFVPLELIRSTKQSPNHLLSIGSVVIPITLEHLTRLVYLFISPPRHRVEVPYPRFLFLCRSSGWQQGVQDVSQPSGDAFGGEFEKTSISFESIVSFCKSFAPSISTHLLTWL